MKSSAVKFQASEMLYFLYPVVTFLSDKINQINLWSSLLDCEPTGSCVSVAAFLFGVVAGE